MRRIYYAIYNRCKKIKDFFWKWYFTKILKKPCYVEIKRNQLFLNWLFQRIFGINKEADFSVSFTSKIQGASRIKIIGNPKSILKSFAVNGGCYYTVFSDTELIIGEDTIWSTNVCIQTGNHDLINRNIYHKSSVKIGKNCWIGTSVTILAGVQLGDNVTVGANSVVTKSFPSNCVIAGVPAKIIKQM
jgi:acetyltransferase-like isoleucine patch superfamily enzyme